ncbi:vitelline membrane outer layer protein 1-like [Ascaphus truei]|uniref:vitelline membrane outer layer protein 1-like n=1 Tax=Ascaphus truei TaxID=8439 RepID=UPI003F5AA13C
MFQTYITCIFLLLAENVESHNEELGVISVSNGGQWGEWGPIESCPLGYSASGFTLKVEKSQGLIGDDTGLNGISLQCTRPGFAHSVTIHSTVGKFGEWQKAIGCEDGYLKSFSLKVEPPQGAGDDTAANNIKFTCSDKSILEGHGTKWGKYGAWSTDCLTAICGLQTRVEPAQGVGDDTALNDVRFICCNEEKTHFMDL